MVLAAIHIQGPIFGPHSVTSLSEKSLIISSLSRTCWSTILIISFLIIYFLRWGKEEVASTLAVLEKEE